MTLAKANGILKDLIDDGFSVSLVADAEGALVDVGYKSTTLQFFKLKALVVAAEKHECDLLLVNGQPRFV